MANTTVGAQVNVEFSSVGQMRKAIKEATSELIMMQDQFGKTSPQAIEAAKRIAELKDRIADAKEQADLFDPGKRFSAFANAANQIAAGFSAVQGAMALVGTESEDLQKTLVKVQGAVALSQGLSQLKDLGKAYDEVKIVAVDAFKSIKAAIGSTGIGLLLVALGTIVAYWDDIKAAVSGVSSEQKKLNEDSAKNLKTQQDKLDAIGEQDNILKLQGKSERQILQIKIKQTDETIKAAEIQLKNSIETTKAQVAAAERNKTILQGILTFISAPIAALLKGIDLIGSAVGKNFDLYNKFYGGISSLVFDPAKTKEEGDKTIKEQEKALTQLKNNRAGLQLQIQNIDKDAAKKSADNQEKVNAEKLKNQEAADKVLEEARLSKLTDQQREEEEAYKKFTERRLALEAAGIFDYTAIAEQGEIELKAIRDKYRKIQEEADKKAADEKLEKEKKEAERLKAARENTLKVTTEFNAQIVKAENDLQDAKFAAASAGLNAITTLAGGNERIANTVFAIEKAMAIAKIVIDTQKEIASYYAAGAANPINALAPGAGMVIATKQALAAKIRAGVSIASIIATTIAKYKGGGSPSAASGPTPSVTGGGEAPVAAMPTPTVTAQALNAQAINNLGNQGMRAYVLNSDITNNEQRNAYLQRNARLG